jgi:hypothetical protein
VILFRTEIVARDIDSFVCLFLVLSDFEPFTHFFSVLHLLSTKNGELALGKQTWALKTKNGDAFVSVRGARMLND